MTEFFPSHLQSKFIRGSWNEKRSTHYREFETDSGASLRSKIPGSAKTYCSGQMSLREEEFSDLEAFYITPCAEGCIGFYLEHPRLKANKIFQWDGPPTVTHRGFIYWLVSLSLIME